jgi:ribonuclease III
MKADDAANLAAVEGRIGHRFKNRELIRTALTHASAVSPDRDTYQRLEFLGDRVLGLAVAQMLVEAFPEADEGELSPRLAELVRKETCADVAATLGLGDALVIGGGKAQQRALQTRNVLGDVCEAVIGAIFLDAGYAVAQDFVTAHWRERMLKVRNPRGNAKTALQEWVQGRGLGPPRYAIAARTGPDHDSVFAVEVVVDGYAAAHGEGRTRREAEQEAAETMLVRERVWDDIR